jgi:hypothetical protein
MTRSITLALCLTCLIYVRGAHPALAGTSGNPYVTHFISLASECGVRTDYHLECWGWDAGPPAGKVNSATDLFSSIEAGQYLAGLDVSTDTTCLLRKTSVPGGPVVCWGEMKAVPSTPFVSISISGIGGCGIRRDASIDCWNDDKRGMSVVHHSGSFQAVSYLHTYPPAAFGACP